MDLKKALPNISIVICLITAALINFNLELWNKKERVIEHDVHHYYGYLPAYFIYDDIKIEKQSYEYSPGDYYFWPITTKEGHRLIKMTMGIAYCYSPFFFGGHAAALLLDYPPTGFSVPYKVALQLSGIFFMFLGLFFIKKLLQNIFSSKTSIAITLLILGIGTNLLCYSSQSATYSHVYSFALVAAFVYYSTKWHNKSYHFGYSITLGLLLGLISLIRPNNLLILVFLALYGVNNWLMFKERLKLVTQSQVIMGIAIIGICTLIPWLPQFAYWKTTTGSYLFYSYNNERFFFDNPKIISGLFSFKKGWLVYTPLMTLALVGLVAIKQNLKSFKLAITVFLIINLYVTFSWWCWWYGGSFGQRSLIDSYALLAIPLCAFISFIWKQKYYIKIGSGAIICFFIWLNIFQVFQYEKHILHYDSMSRYLYFKQFGKLEKIDDFDQHLKWSNYADAMKGKR